MMKALLIYLTLLLATQVNANEITGRVVGVADGDTITVLDGNNTQHKIRLLGIDAPEKKQAFGEVSKQSLSELVAGEEVAVDYSKRDRYGRIIGKVLLDNNDINLEQVKRGLAWHYKQYQREQEVEDRSLYSQAEYTAQHGEVGLWTDKKPIPPWEFRRSKRK
jgi:endonuclease YncB( thermonuclease family)